MNIASVVLFLVLLLLTPVTTVGVSADDTDIYRSLYDIEGRGGNPQVMIIFDTSGSMRDVVGEGNKKETKINIAQRVIHQLVADNPNVNFGLAIFNYNGEKPDGGRIISPLPGEKGNVSDWDRQQLLNTIDDLGAMTSTPLCETYYEIFRYFNGDKARYGTKNRYQYWGYLYDTNPEYSSKAFIDERSEKSYASPLRPCEPLYVIYMTDGIPQYDVDANNHIQNLVRKSDFYNGCRVYPSVSSSAGEESCMPELSYYMQQLETFSIQSKNNGNGNEKKSGESIERGPVTTYTIGFDTDQQLLADTASPLNTKDSKQCPVDRQDTRYHGKAACVGDFTAFNADQLYSAFQVAIDDILSRSTTFSAPAVSAAFTNNAQSFDRLYLPRFLPFNEPRWSGNVKRLQFISQQSWRDLNGKEAFNSQTGDILDSAYTWWSGANGLSLNEPDGNNVEAGGVGGLLRQSVDRSLNAGSGDGRIIYTDVSNHLVPFDITMSLASRPEAWGLPKNAEQSDIDQLIAWARGRDVDDEDNDNDTLEARPWIMGDILHSDPIALNYGGEAQADEKLYLAFGTNAGFLHFVDGDSGKEEWAFTPSVLAPLHHVLRQNDIASASDDTLQHPYGVDGPASYVRIDSNGDGQIRAADGDHMILAFGLRRGGRQYYGLDVTTPTSPKLAWTLSPAGEFAELGQSWAAPIPVRVPGHANPVFVISGGYDSDRDDPTRGSSDPDGMGRAVYIVDALDGSLVYRADVGTPQRFVGEATFRHAIPAASEAVDYNSDGVADRIYLGDMGADLWRLDLDSDDSRHWRVRQIASLGGSGIENRRLFNAIDFVSINTGSRRQDLLLVGSGDRANPKSGGESSDLPTVKDAFFLIRDPVSVAAASGKNPDVVDIDQLKDVTNELLCDRKSDAGDIEGCLSVWQADDTAGWVLYLDDGYSLPLPGAKVLSESVTLNGTVYFSAYVPDEPASVCIPVIGRSYLFGLDLLTAGSARGIAGHGDNLVKGERAVDAGEYLLGRPSLIVKGDELFLQGVGTAELGQLVNESSRGNTGGIILPYRLKRTYWYEKTEDNP